MATLIESGVLRSDPAFLIRSLIAFWVVGSFAVLTRIGIRWLILRRVIIEETTMFTAFLCWTGSTFVTLKALEYGKKGFAEDSTLELERGAKAYMAAWFLYITAVWSCKASIVLFYMRLSEKIGRTESHHVPAFVVAISYFVCIFVLCFICKPFSNNWSLTPDETQSAACNHHEENYVAIVGALDIVTDIMLLLIAVPIVAAMRICPVQKLVWSVCCGGAGVFVIVATALRIYFVYSGNGEQVVFWAMVETATLFIVINALGIKSISEDHRRQSSIRSNRKHSSSTASESYELNSTPPMGKSHVNDSRNAPHRVGESREHNMDSLGPSMVIHHNVTYDITVETLASGSPLGSLEQCYLNSEV